jgi:undecaprenyl-diphosphatase
VQGAADKPAKKGTFVTIMSYTQAILLGIVQGLTEFLPISSSGHLVIVQHLFGLRQADLAFDVSVHLGTLMAVVAFFRKDIIGIIMDLLAFSRKLRSTGPFGWQATLQAHPHARLAGLIVIGSIPTAVLGLFLKQFADRLFASPFIAGGMLLVTGTLLVTTRRPQQRAQQRPTDFRRLAQIRILDALMVGVSQGLAVMPGLSRSGTTITVAIHSGIHPEAAARFSFLLSIPAVAGAALLVLREALAQNTFEPATCLIGALAALVVGYAALALLVFVINRGRLFAFAPYCWLAGTAAMFLAG